MPAQANIAAKMEVTMPEASAPPTRRNVPLDAYRGLRDTGHGSRGAAPIVRCGAFFPVWRFHVLHLDNLDSFLAQAVREVGSRPLVRDQSLNAAERTDSGDASATQLAEICHNVNFPRRVNHHVV